MAPTMRLVATALFIGLDLLHQAWAIQSGEKTKADQKTISNHQLPVNSGIHSVSPSLKYLIASFPSIKTVGYTHLPDTVWRPLYLGEVEKPMHVAVDAIHQRLYVSDQKLNKIFMYGLIIEPDGLLKTDGHQRVAINEMNASWMAVNGLGDLYFSGLPNANSNAPSPEWAVYRMDNDKISTGSVMDPTPIYTRSNSGYPTSAVWMPSGVAVDSFNIYWGNSAEGETHGALCSGTRQNIGVTTGLEINLYTKAFPEIRGMTVTGQTIYYLTPNGVYGLEKSTWTDPVTDPTFGKLQSAPGDYSGANSIAFDGESTLFWTETESGIIYSVPASDTNPHPLMKYVDAPQVWGVAVFSLAGLSRSQVMKAEDGGIMAPGEVASLTNQATVEDSGARHAWSFRPLMFVLAVMVAAVCN